MSRHSINIPHTLDVHHVPIPLGSSPGATSDISGTTSLNNMVNSTSINLHVGGGGGSHHNNSNFANNNTPNTHVIGEHAEADIHSAPASPWRLGSTDAVRNGYAPPPARNVHTYPPQNSAMSMLSQSPSMHASGLHQQLQQQQQNQHPQQYQYHQQQQQQQQQLPSYHQHSHQHHQHSHQYQNQHSHQHPYHGQAPPPPEMIHWSGGARSLPHNPPPQMLRPMSLGQPQQHSHSHSHLSQSYQGSHHAPPPPILQGGGGAAIGYSGEAAPPPPPDTLGGGGGSNHNLNINLNPNDSNNNLATNNLAMLSSALNPQESLYQEKILHQSSQSVEAVLGAGCDVMGFDIAEVWLRTGPKTHQLTNSHLRPTALEDSLRKQLVDVYYGDKSSERTHRLSPALCKRAKEASDVVWVTAHTPQGAEALRCSISNVRTAVAIPVCHEASNTNMTIIFFSIRRILMQTTAVEFLVHMSLGAAVASVNCLAEDGLLDRPTIGAALEASVGEAARSAGTRSEHIGGDRVHHPTVVATMSHQRMEKVSITGARLDLQWRQLQNVEYLTDGGNSWIHTAVYNGKSVVVKTLKPECQDLALAINEIESELGK